MTDIGNIAHSAKIAAGRLAAVSSLEKNAALLMIAEGLANASDEILSANASDIAKATAEGYKPSLIERLTLTQTRIRSIAQAVAELTNLEDPVGKILSGTTRPNGLKILKTTVPLGVVGMIYESRPNVTVDAAALCLKAGNACILRGGKETITTNICLVSLMQKALKACDLDENTIQLIEDADRKYIDEMMVCNGYIDVLIPRGGAALIERVIKNATVPVIATGVGNCHVFVDSSADLSMAVSIADNAKNSRPSVCNAAETLLVHEDIAAEFLPKFKKKADAHHTKLMLCEKSYKILGALENTQRAGEEDWSTEYLDYILSVKIVRDIEEAIAHINKYSTHHSEAIVTNSYENAQLFTARVDSAAVYVNASTRFTDGAEFGMGAEIGISTQKLHARGPMGLDALTTVKYIVEGNGQIR